MHIKLSLDKELRYHQSAVREIGVHGEEKLFFARSDDMLVLYHLESGEKVMGLYASEGYSGAFFGPGSGTLTYASGGMVHSFDLHAWQDRMVYPGELYELRDTAVHVGKALRARGGQDGIIRVYGIWSREDEDPMFELSGHKAYIEYLVFDPSGEFLLSSSGDRTIRAWDLSMRAEVPVDQMREDGAGPLHRDIVTALAFTPDGSKLLTGDYSGVLRICRVNKAA